MQENIFRSKENKIEKKIRKENKIGNEIKIIIIIIINVKTKVYIYIYIYIKSCAPLSNKMAIWPFKT
jgi:hypothetical protein